ERFFEFLFILALRNHRHDFARGNEGNKIDEQRLACSRHRRRNAVQRRSIDRNKSFRAAVRLQEAGGTAALRSPPAFTLNLISSPPLCSSNSHSAGTSAGAPLFLIKNTRNFAGLELLAFRSTR